MPRIKKAGVWEIRLAGIVWAKEMYGLKREKKNAFKATIAVKRLGKKPVLGENASFIRCTDPFCFPQN